MDKRIAEYVRRRNEILLHGTPEDLLVFLKECGHTPSSHEVLMMAWHKSITAILSLPKDYRQKSKDWLTARGYHSLDDGDLTP